MLKFRLLVVYLFIFVEGQAFDTCHYILKADFVAINACPNQDVGLFNISIHSNSRIRWNWNFGDSRSSSEFNPYLSYVHGGVYRKISLMAFDSVSGCRDSIFKYIEIFRKPESDFKSVIKYFNDCPYRQLTAYETNPIDHSFHWFLPNGDSIYITGKNFLLIQDTLNIVQDKITLKVRSNEGCVSQTSRQYNLVGISPLKTPKCTINNSRPNSLEICSDKPLNLELYDHQGHLIQKVNSPACTYVFEALDSGIYYVLTYKDGALESRTKTVVY